MQGDVQTARRFSTNPVRLLSWLMLACAIGLAGCLFLIQRQAVEPLTWYRMDSLHSLRGITGRSMAMLPTGLCIVMHYPPSAAPAISNDTFLLGDPATPDDDGAVVTTHRGYWEGKVSDSQNDQTRFNCVTFALGETLGLTSRDWIEPLARVETAYSMPAQVILDSYYERIAAYSGESPDWGEIETDTRLTDEDVFCYVLEQDGRPKLFAHMGKIQLWNGKHMLVSKLGYGPIVRCTLKSCGDAYAGQFTTLQVYRKRGGLRL